MVSFVDKTYKIHFNVVKEMRKYRRVGTKGLFD